MKVDGLFRGQHRKAAERGGAEERAELRDAAAAAELRPERRLGLCEEGAQEDRLRQQRRQLSGALETAADRLDEIDLALRALRGGGLRGLDELLGQRGRLSRSLRVFVEKLML